VEPWSGVDDPDFLKIVAEMRAADATIVNLETVIHEFKGYAQADCGGTYMASPPEIAGELKWAGIDMVSGATNHIFDYGSTGVLETIEHVEAAGVIPVGIGKDLEAARQPAFLECPGGTVAMVSMASSFIRYGRASRSRPGMHGRPGLNPLGLTGRAVATITPAMARMLQRLRFRRRPGSKPRLFGLMRFLGIPLLVGEKASLAGGRGVDPGDLAANLAAIGEAVAAADLTVVSLHAHRQGGWLRRFARRAIDHGADIVFVHGPHEVRAIEFHAGKPIFYCMGDFVYQPDLVAQFPAEMYDWHGLGPDATVKDLLPLWERTTGLGSQRKTFESFCSVLDFNGGRLERIRLLPLDLQFDAPPEIRGRPRLADATLGRKIIEEVAALSRRHGTTIRYDASRNEGIVELP
jgi:poly-gamma-glutamate synthesis protein (capsule biosynthesis protein)